MADVDKTGIVSEVSSIEWESRNGDILDLYSFQIEGDKRYFRTGTEDAVREGEAIRFTFNTNKNQVDIDSIETIDPSEVEDDSPPKRRSGRRASGRASAQTSTGGARGAQKKTKSTENWDARAKYWEDKEKRDKEVIEPRITYSAASRDAVSVVTAAVQAGAFDLGKTKSKQLDVMLDAIDEVAQRFYEQRFNLEFVEGAEGDDYAG